MSCSTVQYYQIAQTKPQDPSVMKNDNDDSGYYYEDQNCLIRYDFWSENGDASFTVLNKTDQILYVLKDKSFFVRNGESFALFEGKEWTDVVPAAHKTIQNRTIEQPIVAIAPHTRTTVASFAISKFLILDCDLERYPKKNQPVTMAFTKENSPTVFGNVITYRVGNNGQEKMVKNMFYTSRVTNYQQPDLFYSEKRENCPNVSSQKYVMVPIIRFAPGTGYYKKYVK